MIIPQTPFQVFGNGSGLGHLNESACVLRRLCCWKSVQARGEKFLFHKYKHIQVDPVWGWLKLWTSAVTQQHAGCFSELNTELRIWLFRKQFPDYNCQKEMSLYFLSYSFKKCMWFILFTCGSLTYINWLARCDELKLVGTFCLSSYT